MEYKLNKPRQKLKKNGIKQHLQSTKHNIEVLLWKQ